jgi:MFS family permease
LLGVFISQTDQSFVLATYGAVSSEFDDLASGSWLISAYILGQCVFQPLYGKMSDVYGRKACLQASYILFVVGTTVSGLGQSMGQVIAGRAIQGAGGAGMVSMVSIIITDLVPLKEVATLFSYVNILQTTGRSCGGFLGGLLTQTFGWRLAFLIQVPPVVIAIFLVQWQLHIDAKGHDKDHSTWQKLARVDFIGAFFLCYAIFAGCFVLDVGGEKYAWASPELVAIIVSGVASLALFVITAQRVSEPIFPLRLLKHYGLVTNYLIVLLQVITQLSLMMAVPLYFQATKHANTAAAGAYLVPAFVGNTLGGLLSGYWIRRTGRYKWPTVLAPILSVLCMLLCLFFWNGDTSVAESTYIFPGGFATGMVTSAAFVGMAAAVQPEDVAIAGNGMYLFLNIGAIAGASSGSAAYQGALRSGLKGAFRDVKHEKEVRIYLFRKWAIVPDADAESQIQRRLLDNIAYLWKLSERLREIAMPAYVQAFHSVICE